MAFVFFVYSIVAFSFSFILLRVSKSLNLAARLLGNSDNDSSTTTTTTTTATSLPAPATSSTGSSRKSGSLLKFEWPFARISISQPTLNLGWLWRKTPAGSKTKGKNRESHPYHGVELLPTTVNSLERDDDGYIDDSNQQQSSCWEPPLVDVPNPTTPPTAARFSTESTTTTNTRTSSQLIPISPPPPLVPVPVSFTSPAMYVNNNTKSDRDVSVFSPSISTPPTPTSALSCPTPIQPSSPLLHRPYPSYPWYNPRDSRDSHDLMSLSTPPLTAGSTTTRFSLGSPVLLRTPDISPEMVLESGNSGGGGELGKSGMEPNGMLVSEPLERDIESGEVMEMDIVHPYYNRTRIGDTFSPNVNAKSSISTSDPLTNPTHNTTSTTSPSTSTSLSKSRPIQRHRPRTPSPINNPYFLSTSPVPSSFVSGPFGYGYGGYAASSGDLSLGMYAGHTGLGSSLGVGAGSGYGHGHGPAQVQHPYPQYAPHRRSKSLGGVVVRRVESPFVGLSLWDYEGSSEGVEVVKASESIDTAEGKDAKAVEAGNKEKNVEVGKKIELLGGRTFVPGSFGMPLFGGKPDGRAEVSEGRGDVELVEMGGRERDEMREGKRRSRLLIDFENEEKKEEKVATNGKNDEEVKEEEEEEDVFGFKLGNVGSSWMGGEELLVDVSSTDTGIVDLDITTNVATTSIGTSTENHEVDASHTNQLVDAGASISPESDIGMSGVRYGVDEVEVEVGDVKEDMDGRDNQEQGTLMFGGMVDENPNVDGNGFKLAFENVDILKGMEDVFDNPFDDIHSVGSAQYFGGWMIGAGMGVGGEGIKEAFDEEDLEGADERGSDDDEGEDEGKVRRGEEKEGKEEHDLIEWGWPLGEQVQFTDDLTAGRVTRFDEGLIIDTDAGDVVHDESTEKGEVFAVPDISKESEDIMVFENSQESGDFMGIDNSNEEATIPDPEEAIIPNVGAYNAPDPDFLPLPEFLSLEEGWMDLMSTPRDLSLGLSSSTTTTTTIVPVPLPVLAPLPLVLVDEVEELVVAKGELMQEEEGEGESTMGVGLGEIRKEEVVVVEEVMRRQPPSQTPTPPASPPPVTAGGTSPMAMIQRSMIVRERSLGGSVGLGVDVIGRGRGRSRPSSPRFGGKNLSEGAEDNKEKEKECKENKENEAPEAKVVAAVRPAWSLRADEAPMFGLASSETKVVVKGTGNVEDVAGKVEGVWEGEKEEKEKEREEEDTPQSPLPGSFPDVPVLVDLSSKPRHMEPSSNISTTLISTPTAPSPAYLSTIRRRTMSLPSAASSASSAILAGSHSIATTLAEMRMRRPSPLDVALAMQMRPGLGAGADPAWMVRFLMAMFGWMVVVVSGGGEY